jgi:hypothetical protein
MDSLEYHQDADCDRDNEPDSLYLAREGLYVGDYFQPEFDLNGNERLDWCEDCNTNCVLDSEEIAAGSAPDCNENGIPDACDMDPVLPAYHQFGCTPPGGQTPCSDYGCAWSFYSRPGGGSFDCNTNGTPDECEMDCNTNGVEDSCDITQGTSEDLNLDGVPDECLRPGHLHAAVLRKANSSGPEGVCDVPIELDHPYDAFITTESRQGGITQLVLTYSRPPIPGPLTLREDATCPSPPDYEPYAGASQVDCVRAGNVLTCTFTPGLENARTYRVSVPVSSTLAQFFEVRALVGDVNGDGFVNAVDRSVVVGTWTSPSPFSCATDVDSSGATNAVDRAMVVGAWTGTQNCAP